MPLYRRRYSRHTLYAYDEPGRSPLRRMAGFLVIVAILALFAWWILSRFGFGGAMRESGVLLSIEQGSNVNVSIEGEELRRGESGQKLFPGDRVTTAAKSHASLAFFDGTVVRLDETSDISLVESAAGEESAEMEFHLSDGAIWMLVPDAYTASGSIERHITTSVMELSIPDGTEAVIRPRAITVFAAEGLGINADVVGGVVPVVVGEGQQLALPETIDSSEDLYRYRSALDPLALLSPLVESSRALAAAGGNLPDDAVGSNRDDSVILAITEPKDDAVIDGSTVTIRGKAGPAVDRVRINGYAVTIKPGTGEFTQELALPDADTFDITAIAIAKDETVLLEEQRTVRRNRQAPAAPSITRPAANGQTYRTKEKRFLIEGTTSADTVGIIVNDYRLQLYTPGAKTWQYLASTDIENLKDGTNVFEVRAINKNGIESEPATITVIVGEGDEGIVTEQPATDGGGGGATSSAPAEVDPATLPKNDPLQPATLKVTTPVEGTTAEVTEAFVLEGITSADTETMWINDYRLRLYNPGKTTWNYLADPELKTLTKGANAYEIIARNKEGKILDKMTYTVTY